MSFALASRKREYNLWVFGSDFEAMNFCGKCNLLPLS